MKSKQLFIVDENVSAKGLLTCEDLIHIKRGSKDPDIIRAFNVIDNPIVFFTRNPKDFKNKLKTGDQIVKVGKEFTQELLNDFIPKASTYIRKHTGLHSYPTLSLSGTTSDDINIIAQAGTNFKKYRLIK